MLIISNFKDYYDAALFTGVDKKLVFKRLLKTDTSWDYTERFYTPNELRMINLSNKTKVEFSLFTVLFCGKGYRGVKATTTTTHNSETFVKSQACYYNYTDLVKKYPTVARRVEEHKNRKYGFMHHTLNTKDWFGDVKLLKEVTEPILVRDGAYTITNAKLEDYQFWKVMPFMTAYQELSMFIGSTNTKTNEIDDKYKAAGKGFDCYSFKKEPTKRKRKQCRRLK